MKDLFGRFRQRMPASKSQRWEVDWRPIVVVDQHRWLNVPFDLRFDAKWTNQPGSRTAMHPDHSITVEVTERPEKGPAGMRFAIGHEWKTIAAGKMVELNLRTSCQTGSVPFNLTYIAAGRGAIVSKEAYSGATPASVAIAFSMAKNPEERPDQLVIEPLAMDAPLTRRPCCLLARPHRY